MIDNVFLLFEDTKKSHKGFSFSNPVARISTCQIENVKQCLSEVSLWQKKGYYIAGFIAYEAGWACLPKKTRNPHLPTYPLVDLYVFEHKSPFNFMSQDKEMVALYDFKKVTNLEKYARDINKIFEYLKQGESYQVNYTQRMSFKSTSGALETYQKLRKAQRVEYAAFLDLIDVQILSFSPELFIKKVKNTLITRPMKGTSRRDPDPIIDQENKKFLKTDEKNRAENVMIVDLLRNDLGQIAIPGTVQVSSLFHVEEYETVFQMVSEIQCEVQGDLGFHQIFKALFPCGSITGAPKLRTMEIINDLESEPRGVYTGAIGFIEPGGDFCFNVAIRTLVKEKNKDFVFGMGGGILIDSVTADEAQEADLKSHFLNAVNDFFIFETFRFDGVKAHYLTEHLERLQKSAAYFSFQYSLNAIEESLNTLDGMPACRVKLCLWSDGRVAVETYELEPTPLHPEILVSTTRIDASNIFQHHKTSKRELYDQQYKKAKTVGFYDVLYLNSREEVVEASRHNIFIKKGSEWYTPLLTCGALAGIERARAIKSLHAQETVLTIDDVKRAQEILLTNSVRGQISVKLRDAL